MVITKCRTNLDGYSKCTWPTVMAAVPNIGDKVRSKEGKVLKVVGITHECQDVASENFIRIVEARIEVELNK